MAVTIENNYVGDGSTVLYSFTFPYIKKGDVKCRLNGIRTTEYSLANATTVEFDSPPANGVKINIFRQTYNETVDAVFYPGSTIRAQDLNDNFEQTLYVVQEAVINSTDADENADDALETAQRAEEKADEALDKAEEALDNSEEAKQDAAEAKQDAQDAKDAAEKAEEAAQQAGDVGLLFEADPGNGSATKGSNLVPIEFNEGLKLPTDETDYAEDNAIRLNTNNEKLEVRIAGDWTTASAGAEVDNVPPTPATEGDVWWDMDSGRAYVYYVDSDSGQWVEMNPSWNGSIGDGSLDGSKITDGTISIDKLDPADLLWERNGTMLSPANSGDDLDDIGSITAAGDIRAGDYDQASNNNNGAQLGSGGALSIQRDSSTALNQQVSRILRGNQVNFHVEASGTTKIGGSGGTDNPNITLNEDGRIIITGSLTCNYVSAEGYYGRQGVGGTITSNVNNMYWSGTSMQLWVDSVNLGDINYTSDYRIKRDIQPIESDAVSRIKALNPVSFKRADYGSVFKRAETTSEGFIAHEVQEVIPSGATGTKDCENEVQSLRLDAILAVTVKALQESVTRIEALEAQLTALQEAQS